MLGRPRRFVMRDAYTGPGFDDAAVDGRDRAARAATAGTRRSTCAGSTTPTSTARSPQAIADGKVVGWFQGRMEFGPRALGNRSIVADPRRADMKDILNQRIKHRETYRPVRAQRARGEGGRDLRAQRALARSCCMVYKVQGGQRARIPAVTHVDDTGRLQTVSAATNPRYHALISEFERQTGVPLVLNTSFNEHEPIVATPGEALACYLKTRMDVLALGNWVLTRPPERPERDCA